MRVCLRSLWSLSHRRYGCEAPRTLAESGQRLHNVAYALRLEEHLSVPTAKRLLLVRRQRVAGENEHWDGLRAFVRLVAEPVEVALRLRQKAYALKHGTEPPDMVFPSRLGTLLDDANVRHIFKRVLEKAELHQIRFHDLRHTFASLLIQQGESLAYVKEQMGHSSIQVTVDVYGHLVPGGNRTAVDRLDDVQPSATPVQPEQKIAVGEKRVSALERVVTLTFASWNQIAAWLRQLDRLPRAGSSGGVSSEWL